jgi:hypothetical protein
MKVCQLPTLPKIPALSSMFLLALTGCGLLDANIFDTEIRLQRQDYNQDFGKAMGVIPTVMCSMASDPCQVISNQLSGNAALRAACDPAVKSCYVEGSVNLTYPVNLSQDPAFQSSVGQRAVQFVRSIEVGYSMTNTLTVALPEVEIYVGPQDAANKSNPKVTLIGKVGPFKAGQSISDNAPMRLVIPDGSAARTQLEGYIKNPKVPFVFLISTTPRADAGQPLPAGTLGLRLFPKVTVGLPR